MKVYEIINGLKSKKLKPISIAEHFLNRYEKSESKVFAWEEYAQEKIFEHYHLMVLDNIDWNIQTLAGVPLGVKDCYNTEDYFTRRGSEIYKNYRAGNDARLIRKFRDEGAFIFGKTTTAELSIHEPAKTRNPYRLNHTPGTSSGGSACAVATGMVPIAVGTQTAASTSKPCSYCGIYGYKPTFGVFPRTGVLKTSDTLDTLTLLASCVEDIEYVFNHVKLKGENYPIIHNFSDKLKINFENLRVGIITTGKEIKCGESIQKDFLRLSNDLKQIKGMKVTTIDLPDFLNDVHAIHSEIYCKSVAYYFKEEYAKYPELLSNVLKEMIAIGNKISFEKYPELLKKQAHHTIQFQEWLQNNFDFIISPATMGSAPEGLHDHSEKDFSLIWTYLGIPLLIAPAFTGANNMPYGFQISSVKYSDSQLIKFGNILKQHHIIKDAKIVDPE